MSQVHCQIKISILARNMKWTQPILIVHNNSRLDNSTNVREMNLSAEAIRTSTYFIRGILERTYTSKILRFTCAIIRSGHMKRGVSILNMTKIFNNINININNHVAIKVIEKYFESLVSLQQ